MLTADLVNVRRQRNELKLVDLKPAVRERALEAAAFLLEEARAHVGRTREELDEAWDALELGPAVKRVGQGLRKLVEDHCEFDAPEDGEAVDLRRAVFLRASQKRQQDPVFDRAAVLAELAAERDQDVATLERTLYADLKGAHVLRQAPALTPEHLLDLYGAAQAQGVLLRATRVVAHVRCTQPAAYRALFRALKFLRLLCTIHPEAPGGYRLDIDGPFSLFESTTRYGLQLALLLPHLEACDQFTLDAQVLWGPQRQRLDFQHKGGSGRAQLPDGAPSQLPEEVAALLTRCAEVQQDWAVEPCAELLPLPGVGLCVPDLVFTRAADRVRVYLEVLGFWSRDAVWRRVELVQAGLPFRVVFAASERLRVSEQALDSNLPGALYMYKGVMNARAVLERVEQVAARPAGPRAP